MSVLEKWAQHRTCDDADDNVAQYGSKAIEMLASGDPDSRARWLAAGAEGVLRSIAAEDTSDASSEARRYAREALKDGLGLQPVEYHIQDRIRDNLSADVSG